MRWRWTSLNLDLPIIAWAEEDGVDQQVVLERLTEAADRCHGRKGGVIRRGHHAQHRKATAVATIDAKWRDHLVTLEHLRSAVNFRGLAQRDPLNEYKSEAFTLFESMLSALREDVTAKLSRVRPLSAEEQEAMMAQMRLAAAAARPDGKLDTPMDLPRLSPAAATAPGFDESDPSTWGNPGRNDPCPCGSGKKFKHCHGKLL
jgi:preprotein translocase subunit SecA